MRRCGTLPARPSMVARTKIWKSNRGSFGYNLQYPKERTSARIGIHWSYRNAFNRAVNNINIRNVEDRNGFLMNSLSKVLRR